VDGAVITLRPDGEDIPEFTLNVATTSTMLSGLVNVTVQDRAPQCDTGVVATRAGSGATVTSTTSTTAPATSTTAPSTPAGPTAGSGGPCGAGTLITVVRSYVSQPIEGFDVLRCNERWAAGSVSYGGQDDPWLLEWDGSTWQTGACQRYRDPVDWTKSSVVPEEFWYPCISD
jgi:hypothetical protein